MDISVCVCFIDIQLKQVLFLMWNQSRKCKFILLKFKQSALYKFFMVHITSNSVVHYYKTVIVVHYYKICHITLLHCNREYSILPAIFMHVPPWKKQNTLKESYIQYKHGLLKEIPFQRQFYIANFLGTFNLWFYLYNLGYPYLEMFGIE